MSRIAQLRADRAQRLDDAEAITNRAETENRNLTDEERTRFDGLIAEAERIAADAERMERLATEQAQLAASAVRQAPGAGSGAGTGGPRAGALDSLHNRAADAPWRDFGEFLQATARAGMPGGTIDPRLYRAASGMNTGIPSDGGFLVGTDHSMALLQLGIEAAVIAPKCDTWEIGENSDGVEAPYIQNTSRATGSRFGGVRVYRRGEADTVAATKPTLEKFELRLEDIMGLAYVTDRTLQDARQLEQIFRNAFASEFAFKVDDEIINGTGVGECQGILNADATVSVTKETGQAAATILYENLSKMWIRLPDRSKPRSVWLINGEIEPQLDVLSIVAGTGALEPRFVNYGPDGTLRIKGRPVIPVEQCAALGTVGDIILCDLNEYLLIRKGGIDQQESMHVRFIYGENTFRWTYRINGKSKWRSSVTPYKGSATRSPFVTLATRS